MTAAGGQDRSSRSIRATAGEDRAILAARWRPRAIRLAAFLGASGVILGAFGAHALRARLAPELLEVYKTGVLYHLLHAIALLAVSSVLERIRWPRLTLCLVITGIAIFSGSLYLLAITGIRVLGAITPLGGLSLIAAWLSVAVPPASPREGP